MYDFAILGGAFNPIHNGHLYVADEIIKHKVAQKVIFMPNGNHPLKSTSLMLNYDQRYNLVELAIKKKANFSVSNLDSPKYGVNYTYNLIRRLTQSYNLKHFTFIIGYDNALNFTKWYKFKWLLENVNFTVVSRNSGHSQAESIDERFNLVEIEPYDISSTEIRKALMNNEDVSNLVPSEIIDQLTLYWKNLKLSSHQ